MIVGAIFSELGAVFRNVEVGLFISRDRLWTICSHLGKNVNSLAITAHCKRISIKPGVTPQV